MKQALSFITLGVNNLATMRQFYTEVFGWTAVTDKQDMVLFQLNGFMLALYPLQQLTEETGVRYNGSGAKPLVLSVNVSSRQEVDDLFAGFLQKGVAILSYPESAHWGGYRGYITDAEQNCWEIVWNPAWENG